MRCLCCVCVVRVLSAGVSGEQVADERLLLVDHEQNVGGRLTAAHSSDTRGSGCAEGGESRGVHERSAVNGPFALSRRSMHRLTIASSGAELGVSGGASCGRRGEGLK